MNNRAQFIIGPVFTSHARLIDPVCGGRCRRPVAVDHWSIR